MLTVMMIVTGGHGEIVHLNQTGLAQLLWLVSMMNTMLPAPQIQRKYKYKYIFRYRFHM